MLEIQTIRDDSRRLRVMPWPFPGMNPYLEQDDAWHDFHERFLPFIADRLVEQVRPNYIVKIDEHVYVHEVPIGPRRFVGRADLAVGEAGTTGEAKPAASILEAPVTVQIPVLDIERFAFVEIRDRRSRELVTVVKLLSPSNKRPGADREQYLAKRTVLLESPVHLVEIDLLRGGRPLPLAERPETAYAVLVSRAERRPEAGLRPIGLRERLPKIPVPLRPGESDAQLDLQDALTRIYDAAGYEDYIYQGEPDPPLGLNDRNWAASLVAGLR
jgi:hypothetical protein